MQPFGTDDHPCLCRITTGFSDSWKLNTPAEKPTRIPGPARRLYTPRRLHEYRTQGPVLGFAMNNMFADIPTALTEELVETLAKSASVRIERIVSCGHSSPAGYWYDQSENEFVVLLQGAARLRFEDGVMEMVPGSFVAIPAHRRHRVEWTSPDERTVWLAVLYS